MHVPGWLGQPLTIPAPEGGGSEHTHTHTHTGTREKGVEQGRGGGRKGVN